MATRAAYVCWRKQCSRHPFIARTTLDHHFSPIHFGMRVPCMCLVIHALELGRPTSALRMSEAALGRVLRRSQFSYSRLKLRRFVEYSADMLYEACDSNAMARHRYSIQLHAPWTSPRTTQHVARAIPNIHRRRLQLFQV